MIVLIMAKSKIKPQIECLKKYSVIYSIVKAI